MSDTVITIECREDAVFAGLICDGKLLEYHRFLRDEEVLLEQVVIGKVTDPVGGLRAFMVEIGKDKKGFLNAGGLLDEPIRPGMELPVQIVQEGAGDKGYRVTPKYTLAGRSVVLTPFHAGLSISSRIQEKAVTERFRALYGDLCGLGERGWIFRTDAVQFSDAEILQEAEKLILSHRAIQSRKETAPTGTVLYSPQAPVVSYILSQKRGKVKRIICDDKYFARDLTQSLVDAGASEEADKVELFAEVRWTIREFYHLTGQLMDAVSRKVLLKDGGSIVIDETEALVAIDVNSGGTGTYQAKGSDKAKTVLKANEKAAREIARQIRLRNLSGIIIVDFIDMKNPADQDRILRLMKDLVQDDPGKPVIHGFTKLGLLEITRRRQHLPLSNYLSKDFV